MVVTARDPSGATDSVNVNISVTDVDDKTEIAAASDESKIEYAENGTGPVATFTASDEDGHPIVWTLDGADKGAFEISDAGVLTFKKKPNFEGPADANKNNVYLVTVKASEASKLDIEVTVTDVDEAGKVSLDQPQPQVGRSVTARLKDPDSGVEDERWQWAKGRERGRPLRGHRQGYVGVPQPRGGRRGHVPPGHGGLRGRFRDGQDGVGGVRERRGGEDDGQRRPVLRRPWTRIRPRPESR